MSATRIHVGSVGRSKGASKNNDEKRRTLQPPRTATVGEPITHTDLRLMCILGPGGITRLPEGSCLRSVSKRILRRWDMGKLYLAANKHEKRTDSVS